MNYKSLIAKVARGGLLASVLLGACSQAKAGSWTIHRVETTGGGFQRNVFVNGYGENYGTQSIFITGGRNLDAPLPIPHLNLARVSTSPGSTSDIPVDPGVSQLTSIVDSKFHYVLKWQRSSPGDNPPKTLYIRERAGLYAYKTAGKWGGIFPYNGPTEIPRWQGNYFDIQGSLVSGKGWNVQLGSDNWTYSRGPHSYKWERTETVQRVRQLKVTGDTVYTPDVSFNGSVYVNPGYEEEGDTEGSVQYLYDLKIADFRFLANAAGTFWSKPNAGTKPEINAFVGRGWKINPGDTPADPLRSFFSGSADYSVVAKTEDQQPLFDPQQYDWGITGDGAPLPPTSPNDYLTDPSVSSPVKSITHDLGDIPVAIGPPDAAPRPNATTQDIAAYIQAAKQFPKTTVAEVVVKKEGTGSAEGIRGKAKINWYVPHATIFDLHVALEFVPPEGETLDPSEIPGEEGDPDLPDFEFEFKNSDKSEEGQVDFFSQVRLTPRMVAGAGKSAGKALAEIAVEEVALRGTGKVLRGIRAREIGRTLLPKLMPWADKALAGWRAKRLAKGKTGGELILKFKTTKEGSIGSVNPSKIIKFDPNNPNHVGSAIATAGGALALESWFDFISGPDAGTPVTTAPQPAHEDEEQKNVNVDTIRLSGSYYLYTQAPSPYGSMYTPSQNSNPMWAQGFYLTSLSPERCYSLNIRQGQHSFALFGHPYVWTNSEINWFEMAPRPGTPIPVPKGSTFGNVAGAARFYTPLVSPTTWTIVRQGKVNFGGGGPGKADVPPGSLFPRSNGQWFDAAMNPIADPEGIDPITHLPRKANAYWLPNVGSSTRTVTGNQPIQFRNGYPNFGPWVVKYNGQPIKANIGVQHGTQKNGLWDFKQADIYLGQLLQTNPTTGESFLNSNGDVIGTRVQNWRRNFTVNGQPRPLTWHHNEDMQTMELVPGPNLNNPGEGGISHDGGGTWARDARW